VLAGGARCADHDHHQVKLIEQITAVVAGVRALGLRSEEETAKIAEAIEALPGMQTDGIEHRYREFVVQVGWGGGLKNEAAALEHVRPLDLAAAPQAAALLPTSEGFVLIRRYAACPDETFVNVDRSNVRFSKEASARFRREVHRLFESGVYHPYARGFSHWWVAESSGTIVLDSWFALRRLDEHEHAEQVELIDRKLAERAPP
jgi:hypothetical protein